MWKQFWAWVRFIEVGKFRKPALIEELYFPIVFFLNLLRGAVPLSPGSLWYLSRLSLRLIFCCLLLVKVAMHFYSNSKKKKKKKDLRYSNDWKSQNFDVIRICDSVPSKLRSQGLFFLIYSAFYLRNLSVISDYHEISFLLIPLSFSPPIVSIFFSYDSIVITE